MVYEDTKLSSDHLELRIALLPKFERLMARESDDGSTVQPDFDGFEANFLRLSENEHFLFSGHGGGCLFYILPHPAINVK